MYKLKKLRAVPTLKTHPQIAGEPPTNTTGNQTVAIRCVIRSLNLGFVYSQCRCIFTDSGIVVIGLLITFISNQKLNQLSVTISPPAAEAPSFVTADNIKLEILSQTTISYILKDASYTYSVYNVNNLVTGVIFGLDFLSFNGVQIDSINHSIHFGKPHTCHTESCRKPMALPTVPVLIGLGLSLIVIPVTGSLLVIQNSTESRAVSNNTMTFSNDTTKAYTLDELFQHGIVTKIYVKCPTDCSLMEMMFKIPSALSDNLDRSTHLTWVLYQHLLLMFVPRNLIIQLYGGRMQNVE